MNRKSVFLNKAGSMKENDYSKNVLIPIFSKVYKNGRTSFSGGINEKGKDIIIFWEDELGIQQVIGIQVKKIEGSCNSTSAGFIQLLTQLCQMENEEVVNPETNAKCHVTKRLFVTPFTLEEKHYEHSYGTFCKIKKSGTEILDGERIYKLAERHAPEVIDKIIGQEEVIWTEINKQINNIPLFNALHYRGAKKTEDIYCSVEFTLHHKDWSKYLNNKINRKNNAVTVDVKPESILKIKELNRYTLEHFGERIYKVEDEFSLKSLEDEIKKEILSLKLETAEIGLEIKILRENDFYRLYFNDLTTADMANFIDKTSRGITEVPSEIVKEVLEFGKKIYSTTIKNKNLTDRILHLETSIIDQKHQIGLSTDLIASIFEKNKNYLSSVIKRAPHPTAEYLNSLRKVSIMMSFIDQHIGDFFDFEKYGESEFSEYTYDKKITTPIDQVFNSGHDIILLGGAGSGKTTNLIFHYMNIRDQINKKFVFYSPLSEIAKLISGSVEPITFEEAVAHLLRKKNVDISVEDIVSKITSDSTCFILDSIDEAAAECTDILDSLVTFKSTYPRVQIITSSRYSVSDTMRLGFIAVNLLPFNSIQKENFFSRWFDDKSKVSELMLHLERNKELNSIVDNPLSCTILAVLQENLVPLPITESNLYQKRFELMTGKLDQYKRVFRTSIPADELFMVACSLAYEMHKIKIRSIKIEKAVKMMHSYSNLFVTDFSASINELINPCEIMLICENGEFDFGHLKFQEYLASIELAKDRNIVPYKLLLDPWWHEVIVLHAQAANSIEWIVKEAIQSGIVCKCKDVLLRAIAARPQKEKDKLIKRLESAIRAELEESDF
tara:strand:+ start:1060 stop:3576 length:2517 start_codon:yes stop_codon:yes gene_type:complete